MTSNRLARLDERIAQLRKRLETAERLREAIRDDPELLDLLNDSHIGAENGSAAGRRGRRRKTSRGFGGGPVTQRNFEKVAQYLESKGNEPQAISVLAQATGLKASAVIQLCYRTHKAAFEQLSVPGHKTRKCWRLQKGWKELLKSADE